MARMRRSRRVVGELVDEHVDSSGAGLATSTSKCWPACPDRGEVPPAAAARTERGRPALRIEATARRTAGRDRRWRRARRESVIGQPIDDGFGGGVAVGRGDRPYRAIGDVRFTESSSGGSVVRTSWWPSRRRARVRGLDRLTLAARQDLHPARLGLLVTGTVSEPAASHPDSSASRAKASSHGRSSRRPCGASASGRARLCCRLRTRRAGDAARPRSRERASRVSSPAALRRARDAWST